MSDHRYWMATSKGAMYATQSPRPNPARSLLLALMSHDISPDVSIEHMSPWCGIQEIGLVERLHARLHAQDMVEAMSTPYDPGCLISDQVLRDKLAEISDSGSALLADQQGFCLASVGIADNDVDMLAGLCADLASIKLRLRNACGDVRDAIGSWQCAYVGPMKRCKMFPLFIGFNQFTLMISGDLRRDNRALADMAWMLVKRHGLGG